MPDANALPDRRALHNLGIGQTLASRHLCGTMHRPTDGSADFPNGTQAAASSAAGICRTWPIVARISDTTSQANDGR
jgi:hypothetical protein